MVLIAVQGSYVKLANNYRYIYQLEKILQICLVPVHVLITLNRRSVTADTKIHNMLSM